MMDRELLDERGIDKPIHPKMVDPPVVLLEGELTPLEKLDLELAKAAKKEKE